MAALIFPALLLPLLSFLPFSDASAFIAVPPRGICPIPSALFAKKKKTTKKPGAKADSSGGGGFGRVATKPKDSSKPKESTLKRNGLKGKRVYDAPVEFPPLEQTAAASLVPATPQDGPDLPMEVYAQLGQVYGFNRFNFLKGVENDNEDSVDGAEEEVVAPNKDEDGSGLSFEDLLGTATGGPKIDSVSSLASKKSPSRAPAERTSLIKAATNAVTNNAAADSAAESASASVARAVSLLPPFPHLDVLHRDPLVLSVPDFLPAAECDRMIDVSLSGPEARSPTLGKDDYSRAQRTSSTFYHAYRDVPEFLAATCRLFGLVGSPDAGTPLRPGETYAMGVCEEPQTVRYAPGQKFSWHLDALPPEGEATGRGGAGQRTATLLVYLNDVAKEHGGATTFRDLGIEGEPLAVQPRKGSALIFFPSAGGVPGSPFDVRTVHSGEAMGEGVGAEKWIAQLWLRERPYRPTMKEVKNGDRLVSHWDAAEGIRICCEAQQR